jgi:uncharacterized protein YcbK (DUF882 family)
MTRHLATALALAAASALPLSSGAAQAPPETTGRILEAPPLLTGRSPVVRSALRPPAEPREGRSGKLRIAFLKVLESLDLPFVTAVNTPAGTRYHWTPLFGTAPRLAGEPAPGAALLAPADPGMWRLDLRGDAGASPFTFIVPVPITQKRGGYLNGYYIGSYPTEGSGRSDRYAPPGGFIEVTPENQDLQLSEHFRLRQFLTKDQFAVWPKYVALDTRLIDKLELVMKELNLMGVKAERYYVMSGYRTPQYNGPGGDGRAQLSRHMYGDAADGWVDNDGNGYMDDLNGDGRVDLDDARVMLRAVERVEQKYPELVGGCGIYAANSAHGPFVHIDARGYRARW